MGAGGRPQARSGADRDDGALPAIFPRGDDRAWLPRLHERGGSLSRNRYGGACNSARASPRRCCFAPKRESVPVRVFLQLRKRAAAGPRDSENLRSDSHPTRRLRRIGIAASAKPTGTKYGSLRQHHQPGFCRDNDRAARTARHRDGAEPGSLAAPDGPGDQGTLVLRMRKRSGPRQRPSLGSRTRSCSSSIRRRGRRHDLIDVYPFGQGPRRSDLHLNPSRRATRPAIPPAPGNRDEE